MTQLAGLLAQAAPAETDWTWLAVGAAVVVLLLIVWVALRRKSETEALPERPAPRPEPIAPAPEAEGLEAAELAEDELPEELREELEDDAPAGVVETARKPIEAKRIEAEAMDAIAPERKAPSSLPLPEAKRPVVPEEKVEEAPPAKAPPKPAEKVAEKAPVIVEPVEKPVVEKPKSLKEGLGRTRREGFIARLGGLFSPGKKLDKDLLDELEEVLFTADIGVKTADRLLESVRETLGRSDLKDAERVWGVMREEAKAILGAASANGTMAQPAAGMPRVTMVLGVNGTGKTTSIGKLANQAVADGKKVVLIAGDTFRAAAAEQLEHWGRRVGANVMRGKEGADPASVVFDGLKKAVEEQADVVLVDTAGRLHTQVNLMEELRKVRRVMTRAVPDAPHEVLMVLDATTGQNAIQQAKMFKEATDVTGIILTKLDGTAKGGVVIGVCDELAIPIRYIGVGERVSDLRTFQPDEFVEALFTPPSE